MDISEINAYLEIIFKRIKDEEDINKIKSIIAEYLTQDVISYLIDLDEKVAENILNNLDYISKSIDKNEIKAYLAKIQKDIEQLKPKEIESIRVQLPFSILGKLRNGWRLQDIAKVAIQLGGRIERVSGRHEYKIYFKSAAIPLSQSTPYDALVSEIAQATKRKNPEIRMYLTRGYV